MEMDIELVVPFAAGGGTDALAHTFGVASQKYWPNGVAVVNCASRGAPRLMRA